MKKKKRKAGGINCEGVKERKKWTLINFLDNDEEIKRNFESYEDAHMERQWPRGRLDFLEVEGEEKRYLVKHWELPIRVVKKCQ